jgi:hypothetical protein
MKKVFFLVLFSSFTTLDVLAKTGGINGEVKNTDNIYLEGVNIIILKADTNIFVKAGLTDDKGHFDIDLNAGNYILKFSFIGYETFTSARINVSNNIVTIPAITLSAKGKQLKEVAVTAQKPFIEAHADKIVVNVENSIVSAGNSVMDILSKSPGVNIDQNDNISLKGKQGVLIMIDGKIQPLSSTDLANVLKSIPSDIVEKIELISNPSAKYDAAGTAGIINIKTKRDNRLGWNGSLNISYIQGFYPKETGGFNLNFRDKIISAYINYNISYRKGFNRVSFDRNFYSSGNYTGSYLEDVNTVMLFGNHTVSTGIDYSLNSKTTIGASVTGGDFYLGTTGYYYANVFDDANIKQSAFVTNNTSSGNWNNFGTNAHLQHLFDNAGTKFTVDMDYITYWNRNFQDFITNYYRPDGALIQQPYLLHGDITGITGIYSVKADFEHPLKNGIQLETGIKSSWVTANNEPMFYDRSNGGNIYDSTKSDHFIYMENINAAYLNTSKDWKKWSVQAGLRAELSIISGDERVTGQSFDKNYVQLFPSFAIQRHIDKNNDLGITLSRRIERPTYDALNPYKFFVDPSTYKTGNPYLNPALTYSAELSHIFKQRLITTISYSVTSNVITEVLEPSTTQDRVTIQTDANIANMYYYGISGSYTLPIYNWWTSTINANVYYSRYQGYLANTNLNNGEPTFDINNTNRFTLPYDCSAELGFFYQASQVYGFMELAPQWSLSAGLQKNLWNKKASLKLNVSDIFYHMYNTGSLVFTDYHENFLAKHDTRQGSLTFTYRFGKNTVAPVRKHKSGAEEEQQRAGNGGAS